MWKREKKTLQPNVIHKHWFRFQIFSRDVLSFLDNFFKRYLAPIFWWLENEKRTHYNAFNDVQQLTHVGQTSFAVRMESVSMPTNAAMEGKNVTVAKMNEDVVSGIYTVHCLCTMQKCCDVMTLVWPTIPIYDVDIHFTLFHFKFQNSEFQYCTYCTIWLSESENGNERWMSE